VSECLFCQIARGEIPADIIYHDDDVIAFRDINPQAPVHVLVVPRQHIQSLGQAGEADAALLGRVSLSASLVAKQEGLAQSGFRCVVNNGPDAQQTVPHLHMHILGGRSMSWPPG
jgi:histidine triad (HIT) family protein